MEIVEILKSAISEGVSDIFIVAGCPISFKKGVAIHYINDQVIVPQSSREIIEQIYSLPGGGSLERLEATGDDDFSFSVPGMGRFRCNTYKQRNSLAAVLRVVNLDLPDYHQLGIPDSVMELYDIPKGLVLFTGPSGCGKSTTSALLIDRINKSRNGSIVTIEDPIEFLYRHNKSIVSQREISLDTVSYPKALTAALKQAPNVIFLSQLPDAETVQLAINAAGTGQLVISTLHTIGAANTLEHILDHYPPALHPQVRIKLSMVVEAIISQQLIPTVDGRLVPVFEVMRINPSIRTLIREDKFHQIENVVIACADVGMMTMDSGLIRLFRSGSITRNEALMYCTNHDMMLRKIKEAEAALK